MPKILLILIISIFISPFQLLSQTGWYKIYSGPNADVNMYMDMVFLNQTTGFVCGGFQSGGTILQTTNAGVTWLTSLTTIRAILSIDFTDETTGYALGSGYGTYPGYYKTTDCGFSWSVHTLGEYYTYFDSYFFDSNTGFMVGDQGQIRKTTNGGDNWTVCAVYYTDYLYTVDFINQNTGFAAGQNGKIFITTDGGAFWDPIFILGSDIRSIKFLNQTTGFAAGYAGKFLKTTNSGINWQTNDIASGLDFTDLFLFDENRMYISSENGVVMRTTNGGQNWNQQIVSTNSSVKNLYFINESTGFASGSKSYIFTTQTGGELFPLTTLISPSNNSTNLTLTPTLVWTALPDILYYNVQVSTYSDYNVIADSATLTSVERTIPVGKLHSNTFYYWRVRAISNLGIGPWTFSWRFLTGNVGIIPISNQIPNKFNLSPNFPNPFNPMTKIKFDLPKSSGVRITVFDVTGKEVAVIVNETLQAGSYQTEWDASAYPSGVYFYRMVVRHGGSSTGDFSETKKMILVR